jgi:hypothetical protein
VTAEAQLGGTANKTIFTTEQLTGRRPVWWGKKLGSGDGLLAPLWDTTSPLFPTIMNFVS